MATTEEQLAEAKETIKKLQTKVQDVNKESEDRRDENKKLQKIVDAKDGIDMDAYNAAIKAGDKAKNDKLHNEGKIEEITAKVRKDVEAEFKPLLEKAQAQNTKLDKSYRKLAIDNPLMAAAVKAKAVNPGAVVKLLRDQAGLDDDGNFIAKNGDTEAISEIERRPDAKVYGAC